MTSRHNVIMNAFRPAKEVEDPELFAGRSREVLLLTDALHSTGSCPLVYGHRGLGKTSLALQMCLIAQGDSELLRLLNAEERALGERHSYEAFFLTCTDATERFEGLLQQLVNRVEAVSIGALADNGEHLVDRTKRTKWALKVLETETERRYSSSEERTTYTELSLGEKLLRLADSVYEATGHPILLIIDELDRLEDTAGLASFIKAASSVRLKFMLVGIASNISELLSDHQSLERSLVPVELPPMDEGELYEIVENANNYLGAHGVDLVFDEYSAALLASYSGGFPWFVHVIGQRALVSASDKGKHIVDEMDIMEAVQSIGGDRFAQHFSDLYQKAVRDSYQREIVLRSFAEWRDLDIPTGEIYRRVRGLDVANPSAYKGHLASETYGHVIINPVFQERGVVRFSNEMFKVYVRLRASLFSNVDQIVRDAFKH